MNMQNLSPLFLLVLSGCSSPPSATAGADTDAQVIRAQQAVAQLQSTLGQRLKTAMQEGGPVEAVEVCNLQAQELTQGVGEDLSVDVRRVSTRPRNPANRPDAVDAEIVAQMAKSSPAAGGSPVHRVVEIADDRHRFYQAIYMQPLCLACHGEQLAPDVAERISVKYPQDQATGYRLGDFRGAFVVEF